MYEEQFGHTVIEEVVEKEGMEFTLTRGSPPSISTFEQALEEIKSRYEAQFGHLIAEEVDEKDNPYRAWLRFYYSSRSRDWP